MSTAEPANAFAGQGSVLLDIGDDVGAVVALMPAAMEGVEVEIRSHPAASGGHHPHVAVVTRPVAGGVVPSLVFPEVHEGLHDLCLKGSEEVTATVSVVGGEVTTVLWPT